MGSFSAELAALLSVLIIDLVLAGDNAIVVGLAAAGLERVQRRKVVFLGIAAAAILRIFFALVATRLLAIIGLTLAGGILLLWVVWKLWRELRASQHDANGNPAAPEPKTFTQALTQIVVADVSMSLDNVLAVAGTARDHPVILVIGLAMSVALMGVAASFIATLLRRFPWISYVGLAIIAYVALVMIYQGGFEVVHAAQQVGAL